MSDTREVKAQSVLHVTADAEHMLSEKHFYPLVIHFPDEGKILVEEDPEKADDVARDKDYGLKVLIHVFKELQELGDEKVQAILDRYQVRYEEPGW